MCAPGICSFLQATCFVGAPCLNWQPVADRVKAAVLVELLGCLHIPGDTHKGEPALLPSSLSGERMAKKLLRGTADFKS